MSDFIDPSELPDWERELLAEQRAEREVDGRRQSRRQVELDVSGTGTGSVMVDGVNLANVTRRVTVDVDPNGRRGTEVMLHLKFGAVAAALADADVRVDMATSAVLIDLGWTPPGAPAMRVLTESEAKTAIFVLSWHPVDGGDPVEIPLGEGWVLPGADVRVGEFRLSTREVPDGEVSGG